MDPKGPQGRPGSCSTGGAWGRVVLQLCLLPQDKWSEQPWSRVGNYPSNKIRNVPPTKKKKEERNRGLSQMVPASENATVVLSSLLPVLLWSVLWSLLRSARLAIWVSWKVTDSNVCFHMLVTAVPAKLYFATGKIAQPVPCTGTF